jgi:fructose-1,6-bisphosphatase I
MIDEILNIIAEAAPEIRLELSTRRDHSATINPTGDSQLAVDIWVDNLLSNRILALDSVGSYASEERSELSISGEGFSVALDPLDGSSNLLSNNMMGTIIGIYDSQLPTSGRDLISAAYVLYGPITTMVVADSTSVTEYVLDQGKPIPLRENITLPKDPKIYGFGGRESEWSPKFNKYAETIKETLKLRYGGALISDINQILTYGGIFAYPGTSSSPQGKIRTLFEAHPVAYIIESAGGKSTNGEMSILDIEPDNLHSRTPFYAGNASFIESIQNL